MNTLKKWNTSRPVTVCLFAVVFLFMLLCNLFTTLAADDFCYCYSWADHQRIGSLADIFTSLKVHYQVTNGRMIAHFFAFLFLWLPQIIFRLCNTCIFTLLLVLMYRVCRTEGRHSAFLVPVLFGCIWCETPSFGEVYLWLDGSCNYLWSGFFTLLYLAPLLKSLAHGTELSGSPAACISTLLLGIAAGAYLENASAAAIFMAVLLVALIWLRDRKMPPLFWLISIVLSVAGYLTVIESPGEIQNKSGSMSLVVLRQNFITALNMYKGFWLLLLVFGILLISAIWFGCSRGRILTSLVLVLGSLAANFILIFAAYYPGRCAFYSVLLLVFAIGILLPELLDTSALLPLLCAVWLLLLVTAYQMMIGLNDIYDVYGQFHSNEAIIMDAKAAGELDVTVNSIQRSTEYVPVVYNDPDPTVWSNTAIARYYGLDSFAFQ